MTVDNSESGHEGDREEHAADAAEHFSCDYSCEDEKGWEFNALLHDVGSDDIVLKNAKDQIEDEHPEQMWVADKAGDDEAEQCGADPAKDGNDFKDSSKSGEQYGVRNIGHLIEDRVAQKDGKALEEEGANVVAKEVAEVVEEAGEPDMFTRARRDFDEQVTEGRAFQQKEEGEDWGKEEEACTAETAKEATGDGAGEVEAVMRQFVTKWFEL